MTNSALDAEATREAGVVDDPRRVVAGRRSRPRTGSRRRCGTPPLRSHPRATGADGVVGCTANTCNVVPSTSTGTSHIDADANGNTANSSAVYQSAGSGVAGLVGQSGVGHRGPQQVLERAHVVVGDRIPAGARPCRAGRGSRRTRRRHPVRRPCRRCRDRHPHATPEFTGAVNTYGNSIGLGTVVGDLEVVGAEQIDRLAGGVEIELVEQQHVGPACVG